MIENEFILSLKINPNVCSPLPHIWLFSGVLEVKLKLKTSFIIYLTILNAPPVDK